MRAALKLTFHTLTPNRWPDLEKLFGKRGACGGCWCMCWRLARAAFNKGKGDGNKRAFRKLVADNVQPGVLAYDGDEPIGWCAVAPRQDYPYLERSRVLAPVDDEKVWSITCLFVAKACRRRGVSARLLKAAAELARKKGAKIVEGYPVEPYSSEMPAAFAWTGMVSAFQKAGFREVA
ncbi:MAG TPA: GNAT family N-acetyltransferase, partial [Gemmataceae bacterium]|nr:GNAT family N-acetyltransferase [Gemmataceae bacterium]